MEGLVDVYIEGLAQSLSFIHRQRNLVVFWCNGAIGIPVKLTRGELRQVVTEMTASSCNLFLNIHDWCMSPATLFGGFVSLLPYPI